MHIHPGAQVKFNRADGTVQTDVVRELFLQQKSNGVTIDSPYDTPAAVLTNHSWCYVSDIIEVIESSRDSYRVAVMWRDHIKDLLKPEFDSLEEAAKLARSVSCERAAILRNNKFIPLKEWANV